MLTSFVAGSIGYLCTRPKLSSKNYLDLMGSKEKFEKLDEGSGSFTVTGVDSKLENQAQSISSPASYKTFWQIILEFFFCCNNDV